MLEPWVAWSASFPCCSSWFVYVEVWGHRVRQPPRAFSISGLRLYFPMLEPWVTQSASLPAVRPGLSVRVWGRGVLPAALPARFSATLSAALSVYLRECGAAGSSRGQTCLLYTSDAADERK